MSRLAEYQMIPKQGAIPNGIWQNEDLQEYIHQRYVFGYVGHSFRTIRTDKFVIKAWKRLGMSDIQIAEGITWGAARHMADNFDREQSDEAIYSIAIDTGKYLLKQKEFGHSYE